MDEEKKERVRSSHERRVIATVSVPSLVLVILVLGALVASLVAFGAVRWKAGTRRLRASLAAVRLPVRPERVDLGETAALPEPVRRFFRAVLEEGGPMVAGARVRHRGTFNMGETADRWVPFTSDQIVVVRRPGFDWDARIRMMPGLTVRVHDAYVAGEGILLAAALGLVPVMDLRGTGEIAVGELMRFLAESAWYPTALLPSQGVRWEAAGPRSARATMTDGRIELTMLFTFDDEGPIESVRAEARGRVVGGVSVPTPWEGRFRSYERRGGMLVPLEGEVAWILPEGRRPYWRGTIVEIEYEWAHGERGSRLSL